MINQGVKVSEGIPKVRPSEESILHKQGLKQMFANLRPDGAFFTPTEVRPTGLMMF